MSSNFSGFIGIHKSTIQGGNRLIIPTRFRNFFMKVGVGELVVSVGFDNNLNLYREVDWNRMLEKYPVRDVLPTSRKYRIMMRAFFSYSDRVKIDSSGRIVISPEILARTDIESKVIMLGVGTHIEVWSETSFQEDLAKWKDSIPDLVEKYFPMEFGDLQNPDEAEQREESDREQEPSGVEEDDEHSMGGDESFGDES